MANNQNYNLISQILTMLQTLLVAYKAMHDQVLTLNASPPAMLIPPEHLASIGETAEQLAATIKQDTQTA